MDEQIKISSGRTTITNVYTLLFVLMPIIDQYIVFPLKFFELFSIFGVLVALLKRQTCVEKKVLLYIIYTVFGAVSFCILLPTGITQITLRCISFVLMMYNMFTLAPELYDFDYGFKFYSKIVFISVLIIYIQEVLFYLKGSAVSFLIPNMILNYNGGMASNDLIQNVFTRYASSNWYRPTSLFIEPVYFAEYCLPWIIVTLFREETELSFKKLITSLLVTAGICLSTSMVGILCSILIWGAFFVKRLPRSNSKTQKRILYLAPIILIAFLIISKQSDIVRSFTLKRASLSSSTTTSSTTLRLLRGFLIFEKLPLLNQLFGCGYGNLATFFKEFNITTIYDYGLDEIAYMNGAFTLICSVGIVGAVIFCIMLYPKVRLKKNLLSLALFCCWAVIMIGADFLDTPLYFVYLVFLMSYKTRNES